MNEKYIKGRNTRTNNESAFEEVYDLVVHGNTNRHSGTTTIGISKNGNQENKII